jgi:hypothetical protein
MKSGKVLVALAAILVLLVPAAFAESKPKPLTDAEVAKLVSDWPAVTDWLVKKGKQIEAAPGGGIATAVFADKEFSAFMAKKGWTIERYSYVAGTAFYLTAVVALERQNPDTAKQFDDAIAQVQASELPADQKAENIKALQEAKAAVLSFSSDKEIDQDELKIVRGRFDALYELVQSMNGGSA